MMRKKKWTSERPMLMLETDPTTTTIVRTERGLTLAGTRITLYDILTYLKADWPPHLIQQWLNLTETQMTDAMTYIAANRETVDAEYQIVVQHAETNRRYWEERNHERLARIAHIPPKPGTEAIHAKLQERKAARNR
jgi:uncharacterized protein (DUF433 family)